MANSNVAITCQEAFVQASTDPSLTAKQQLEAGEIAGIMAKHPRFSLLVEHAVLASYEHNKQTRLVGTIDWASIVGWVMLNLPSAVEALLKLFALLGWA